MYIKIPCNVFINPSRFLQAGDFGVRRNGVRGDVGVRRSLYLCDLEGAILPQMSSWVPVNITKKFNT